VLVASVVVVEEAVVVVGASSTEGVSEAGARPPPIIMTINDEPSTAPPRFRVVTCNFPSGRMRFTPPNTRPTRPTRINKFPIAREGMTNPSAIT
jgi:hypothetical protein